ncbi:unnamed protein product, partial [Brenthis ino]
MVLQEEIKIPDKVLSEAKVNVNTVIEMYNNNVRTNNSRIRVKRQNTSGASKFTEASKMPQIKQLRIFLQMFKNFFDSSYIGGRHPLHHNVPKAFVALFKQRIFEFFMPKVGEDKELAT